MCTFDDRKKSELANTIGDLMDNKYDIKVVIPYQVGQKIKVVVTYDLDKQFYRKMNRKIRGI